MDCDFGERPRNGDFRPRRRTSAPIWYQKHMPHHMVGDVSIADMPGHGHAFLIRPPERVVASYAAKNDLRGPNLLGYAEMRRYVGIAEDMTGKPPPIVDADDILADPAAKLAALCAALGIAWDKAMLSWEKGPHPEDGPWGPHWYAAVNASTGFAPALGALPELSGEAAEIAAACRPNYEALKARAL